MSDLQKIKDRLMSCLHHLSEIEFWEDEFTKINPRFTRKYPQVLERRESDQTEIEDTLKKLVDWLDGFRVKTRNEVSLRYFGMNEEEIWFDILKRKGEF